MRRQIGVVTARLLVQQAVLFEINDEPPSVRLEVPDRWLWRELQVGTRGEAGIDGRRIVAWRRIA